MTNYQLYARTFPTVISSIPALLFQYFFLNQEIAKFLQFLGNLKLVGDITISIAIIFFLSETIRLIAKSFFEKEETYMPTTDFLLFSSTKYRREIYKKIRKDFKISLPTEEELKKDELNSRKIIAEAMSLVRKKVGSGTLLLQHNIEYGFWRNLIGGTIFAIPFSAIDAYFSLTQSNTVLLATSLILLFVYLIPLLLNKYIIQKVGVLYAKVLIQEYMAG